MLIKNAKIIYPDRIEKGSVRVKDGVITEVLRGGFSGGPLDSAEYGSKNFAASFEKEEIIDAKGRYLSPGFIDIHIHGAGGKDTMEGTKEALSIIAKAIAAHGTTSFAPTTMTMPVSDIRKVVEQVAEMKDRETGGANIIGTHLEGPFISPHKVGAQNPAYVAAPSVDTFKEMVGDHEDVVITMTIAPEVEGSRELIAYLESHGIHASIGHTVSDYDTAMDAIKNGASHVTHLYNAMSGFSHRDPGVVGAAFDSNVSTEFIADGIHSNFAALRIALKQKGTDKIMLISDAMEGCAMPDGEYQLGGQPVFIKGDEARLADGTLAGSVLTLDKAIRNLKQNTTYPLYEIVKMATYNPACYAGVQDKKGLIKPGYDADLVIFDEDINIQKVVIAGKCFEK